MPQLTCKKVVRRNGRIRIRFSDKSELEFESAEEMRQYVKSVLSNEGTQELMRILLIGYAIKVPNATIHVAEGKTIRLDLTTPIMLEVTG